MKKLNKIQTIVFATGAFLMVAATFMFVLKFHEVQTSIIFIIGAICFTVMQNMQSYEGFNPTIRRLRSIMSLADLFFILTGIFMLDTAMTHAVFTSPEKNSTTLFLQFFDHYSDYEAYIYNKWFPLLIISILLELYTTLRLSHELKKESK